MRVQRRTNFLWGLLFLALAIVVLLNALEVLPRGLADLAGRLWPVLLIIGGLAVFLRDRVRFSGLIALVLGTALAGGLTLAAYTGRATQQRTDNQQRVQEPVSPNITLMRVIIDVRSTDVEVVRALEGGQVIGQFTGSTESDMQVAYAEAPDGTAQLIVREAQPSQFPLLEALGRGRLTLELPAGIPMDVSFSGADGAVSLNMSGLSVERLNLDLAQGDALVTLPNYDPRASGDEATLGALLVRDGDITVFVPAEVGARLELNRGGSGVRPEFDPNVYNLLDIGDGVLEARNFDQAAVKQRYTVTAPRGRIGVALAADVGPTP